MLLCEASTTAGSRLATAVPELVMTTAGMLQGTGMRRISLPVSGSGDGGGDATSIAHEQQQMASGIYTQEAKL